MLIEVRERVLNKSKVHVLHDERSEISMKTSESQPILENKSP